MKNQKRTEKGKTASEDEPVAETPADSTEIVHENMEPSMSENRYRLLFESVRDGILFVDAGTGVIIDSNPFLIELLGYSREELVGNKLLDTIPFKDIQVINDALEALRIDRRFTGDNLTLQTKDGRLLQTELACCVYRLGDTEIIQCNIRDVTKWKISEDAFRMSGEYFRSILDHTEDIVMVLSLDGDLRYMSPSVSSFGYTPEEVIGRNIYDYVHPDDQEKAMRANVYSIQNPGMTTYADIRMRHKDGRYTLMAGIGKTVITKSGPPYIIINGRDISERIKTEEALRETNENLRAIINASPLAIFALSQDGTVLSWNTAAEHIFGWTGPEIIGRPLLIVPADKMQEFHELRNRMLVGEIINGAEVVRRRKDGSLIDISISGGPIFNRDGKAESVIALISDITERKAADDELKRHKEHLEELVAERTAELIRVQEQLIHAQKMEAIGQLAGGIAHDFNNILAIIIGTADLVMKGLPEKDPARKFIERINKVANRGKDLTMNLLTFARKDKLDIRTISANELIIELRELLKRSISKKINIQAERSANSPMLTVDVNQVLQALLNVSINACDAMAENGTLKIESIPVKLDEKECKKLLNISPGEYCRITITDTGKGIPQNIMNRIFEPFFTTKERGKGTGLGLPISLEIVQSHKGDITIESESGKGTRVDIFLPVLDGSAPTNAVPATEEQQAVVRGTVMVVDDDHDFLDMTVETLRGNGFKVISANGAARSLELYRKFGKEIDLVILDMMMPEMDGVEVFRLLQTMNPDVKAVVCSGYSRDGKATQILTDGACGFLQKPFNSGQLLKIVSDSLKISQIQ